MLSIFRDYDPKYGMYKNLVTACEKGRFPEPSLCGAKIEKPKHQSNCIRQPFFIPLHFSTTP